YMGLSISSWPPSGTRTSAKTPTGGNRRPVASDARDVVAAAYRWNAAISRSTSACGLTSLPSVNMGVRDGWLLHDAFAACYPASNPGIQPWSDTGDFRPTRIRSD